MNGTIFLNFVGKNVVFTPAGFRPGTVKFYSPDMGSNVAAKSEKQIPMIHTDQCSDNTFEMRVEGTTQPWLGENLYAQDRTPPKIPWKPHDYKPEAAATTPSKEEPQDLEEQKAEQLLAQKYDAKTEFNALANLIVESANDVEHFKVNLFPKKPAPKGAPTTDLQEDDNMISFDLASTSKDQKAKANKIAKDLGNMDVNTEELDGDDLLDLMDS